MKKIGLLILGLMFLSGLSWPATFGAKDTTQAGNISYENYRAGAVFNCPSGGVADSIVAYLKEGGPGTWSTKLAIYDATDSSLIDTTAEFEVDGASYSWYQKALLNSPNLVGDRDYILTVWGEDPGFPAHIYVGSATNSGEDYLYWRSSDTYGNAWPDPWSTFSKYDNYILMLYCVYTPTTTDAPQVIIGQIERHGP